MKKTIKKLSFSGKIQILSALLMLAGLLFFTENASAQSLTAEHPVVSKYGGNVNQSNFMDAGAARVVLRTELARLGNERPVNRTQKMDLTVRMDFFQNLYHGLIRGATVSDVLKEGVVYVQTLGAKYNTPVDTKKLINDAIQLLSN